MSIRSICSAISRYTQTALNQVRPQNMGEWAVLGTAAVVGVAMSSAAVPAGALIAYAATRPYKIREIVTYKRVPVKNSAPSKAQAAAHQVLSGPHVAQSSPKQPVASSAPSSRHTRSSAHPDNPSVDPATSPMPSATPSLPAVSSEFPIPVGSFPPSSQPPSASTPVVEAMPHRKIMEEELTKWVGDSYNRKLAASRILSAFDKQDPTLDLTHLELDSLPPCISYLIHLTTLNLYRNNLQNIQIPDTLTHLTTLILAGNKLENIQIPDTLIHLTTLDLSFNNLQDMQIPATLTHLTHLTTLNLSKNNLQDIEIPATLTHLTTLDLSSNNLHHIFIPDTLNNLTKLNLSKNNLQHIFIPPTLNNLTKLDLSSNRFQRISTTLNRLSSECTVNLENNLLTLHQVRDFQTQTQMQEGPRLQVSIHDTDLHPTARAPAPAHTPAHAPASLQPVMNMWLEEYQKINPYEALLSSADIISLLNLEQQGQLEIFLTKLRACPEYQKSPENLIQKVYRMLSGIHKSEPFKEKAFLHISDALDTCVDRAAIKLKDIIVSWDLILHPAQNDREYAQRLIGHKRIAELEKRAWWYSKGKPDDKGKSTAYVPIDQISVLFRFYIDGWKHLQLPPSMDHLKFTNMAYASMGLVVAPSIDLSEKEINKKTTAVIRQEAISIPKGTSSPDQQMEILFGEYGTYWIEYLERQYSSTRAAYFAKAEQAFEALELSPDSLQYAAALAPVQKLREKASEEWQAWMKKKTLEILSSSASIVQRISRLWRG